LIEDDGPASGYSYQPNAEKLTPEKRIKKLLLVPRPQARRATLLIARGGSLQWELNGKALKVGDPQKTGNYWQAYDIDPARLAQGENAFVAQGEGMVWIARDDQYAAGDLARTHHPNRSQRSIDGGAWRDTDLGDNNQLDGEYYIRLHLDRHVPQGMATTPVLDTANLSEQDISPALVSLGAIAVKCDVELPAGQRFTARMRSGAHPLAESGQGWSDWAPLPLNADHIAEVDKLPGRYIQLEFTMESGEADATPLWKSLQITSKAKTTPSRLRVVESSNRSPAKTSIPFVYQSSENPKLAQLRKAFDLDAVVAGAKTELELIEKLAAWASQRWPKVGHIGKIYPDWNALEILKPHADGTPVGGFCNQFNLVFLQACQSFGVVGRAISIGPGDRVDRIRGGHEVVEVWSNDFKKWIYVDGNTAWYLVDQKTGTPLSLWELRREQLRAFASVPVRPIKVVKLAETRHEWNGLTDWPPFMELRLVPRSDFLDRTAPLPLNQGMRGWFWTGYHVWSDETRPARRIYSRTVEKRENFEWTINTAHLHLEESANGAAMNVSIESDTPNFSHYLARQNDAATQKVDARFVWKLRPGNNQLTIQPVNKQGRAGVVTRVVVESQQ